MKLFLRPFHKWHKDFDFHHEDSIGNMWRVCKACGKIEQYVTRISVWI